MRAVTRFPGLLPVLLLLWFAGASAAVEDDETDEVAVPLSSPAVAASAAEAVVTLDARQQQSAGLVLQTLAGQTLSLELTATARVLDVKPLMEWRASYRAAQAEKAQAEAAFVLSQKNHQRVLTLHREAILAGRVLAEADSHYAGDEARMLVARRRLEDLRLLVLQGYGSELARLWLETDTALLHDWLALRRALLLVTVPAAVSADVRAARVAVGRGHDRSSARPAEFLSRAPMTDELTQGETFYYHTTADGLRSGMRLEAFISLPDQLREAVILPYAAVLWQAGQAWVYRQVAPGRFSRLAVTEHQDYGRDWLVSGGLKPGDQVVVTGGQMLLSEELKRQIPDEDDD